jgi:lipoate---protein ligase
VKLLDLTLPTPEENLALDEALLEAAEEGGLQDEVLRLWEPAQPLVVIGRSSRAAEEVNLETCRGLGVSVLRRCSGGAAIASGARCLMYAVVLRYQGREHLRMLDEAHRFVLGIVGGAIGGLTGAVEQAGTSDLAIAGRKFSGNSLRCKRGHLLYHGTLLYNFDLSLVSRLLRMPPRQPEYREGRSHADFVMNLPLSASELRQALTTGFGADQQLREWPRDLTNRLVAERYSQHSWNFDR